MSEDRPDEPGGPAGTSSGQGSPPPEPRAGSIGFGIIFGSLVLFAIYAGAMVSRGPYIWSSGPIGWWAAAIPIALYLLLAIPLTVKRGTSRFGAGLLIGLGVFILLDGLCLGTLARVGT